MKFIKDRGSLFITAFLQVAFVAMSSVFISARQFVPSVIVGFLISFIWTLNVKRAAFGDMVDRLVYAVGAMIGTAVGYLISDYITKIL